MHAILQIALQMHSKDFTWSLLSTNSCKTQKHLQSKTEHNAVTSNCLFALHS